MRALCAAALCVWVWMAEHFDVINIITTIRWLGRLVTLNWFQCRGHANNKSTVCNYIARSRQKQVNEHIHAYELTTTNEQAKEREKKIQNKNTEKKRFLFWIRNRVMTRFCFASEIPFVVSRIIAGKRDRERDARWGEAEMNWVKENESNGETAAWWTNRHSHLYKICAAATTSRDKHKPTHTHRPQHDVVTHSMGNNIKYVHSLMCVCAEEEVNACRVSNALLTLPLIEDMWHTNSAL